MCTCKEAVSSVALEVGLTLTSQLGLKDVISSGTYNFFTTVCYLLVHNPVSLSLTQQAIKKVTWLKIQIITINDQFFFTFEHQYPFS